jgi:hypothetical protein
MFLYVDVFEENNLIKIRFASLRMASEVSYRDDLPTNLTKLLADGRMAIADSKNNRAYKKHYEKGEVNHNVFQAELEKKS